ncbi:hypothetical protein [Bradyrhizobium genosp. P]|uniref:hypothetical protein n=1 Tax=Bradyrhizobium genosp. P TaxID=83641 RepID=UPI003CF7026A
MIITAPKAASTPESDARFTASFEYKQLEMIASRCMRLMRAQCREQPAFVRVFFTGMVPANGYDLLVTAALRSVAAIVSSFAPTWR